MRREFLVNRSSRMPGHDDLADKEKTGVVSGRRIVTNQNGGAKRRSRTESAGTERLAQPR
jgi:hypothetical protein